MSVKLLYFASLREQLVAGNFDTFRIVVETLAQARVEAPVDELIDAHGEVEWPRAPKLSLARRLMADIARRMTSS